MKLAYWMYAGPAHIGTLRVASSFKNVHAIMHAPLGDDYFNVMRSMLERERDFTPVTASIVDRHVLGRGSEEKVVQNIICKDKQEAPNFILLTPTCTSSILQEDLQNFADQAAMKVNSEVLFADVNHYRMNELQAMDRTLEQIIRFSLEKAKNNGRLEVKKTEKPSVNILGMFTLGFHHQHDCRELKRMFTDLGIDVNLVIPQGADILILKDLPKAWCNIVLYREAGIMAAKYLQKDFDMPFVTTTPMGIQNTKIFLSELEIALGLNKEDISFQEYINRQTRFISQAAWFARSIDCQNLTGKKAVVFGDATHAASMVRILACEMGIRVSCAGTYCKHDADWFREQVIDFCDEILITDDHTQVSNMITRIEPAAIFGTQMERHIGKRLDIPCGVISAPVHIQNFPLGFRPFLGYEGTNQIADLVYNTFTLGMEDHLLEIFGGHDTRDKEVENSMWSNAASTELTKIPGFVRGKVKRNTEKYAKENNIKEITVEVMFAAKEDAEQV
uniref:Light-independent protochlorophyllide reductase subunit B n=1 Tax=Pyramimonas parkeae TaxID=36894 RepID=A0A1R7T0T8_9CHLO|nr:ChlB subunit of protochlorophyllide reductase [Pyramimonas parkeae]